MLLFRGETRTQTTFISKHVASLNYAVGNMIPSHFTKLVLEWVPLMYAVATPAFSFYCPSKHVKFFFNNVKCLNILAAVNMC